MCITYPLRIKKVKNGIAKSDGGLELKTSLIRDLREGEWVLAHANLALKRITKKEAEEIIKLYEKEGIGQ